VQEPEMAPDLTHPPPPRRALAHAQPFLVVDVAHGSRS